MTLLVAQEAANQAYLLGGFVLLAAVIVLIVLELFVPTGGVLAGAAGVAGIASIVAFFMYDLTGGMVALTLYLVLSPIVIWAIFKYWIHSPLAGKMILGGVEDYGNGDETDSVAKSEQARRERLARLRDLIGAEGVTVTPLRPVGTVRIGKERIDAMAETGVIEANTDVVVTDVYDNQIKVRPR